jgi:hypothetical protein
MTGAELLKSKLEGLKNRVAELELENGELVKELFEYRVLAEDEEIVEEEVVEPVVEELQPEVV